MKAPKFTNKMPALARGAHDTNIAGARAVYYLTGRRKQVLVDAHLERAGGPLLGLTDFEAASLLGCIPTTAGSLRSSMNNEADLGVTPWFVKTDLRRISRPPAAYTAIVWRLSEPALLRLEELDDAP